MKVGFRHGGAAPNSFKQLYRGKLAGAESPSRLTDREIG
jgi:hypothetical protein